MICYVCETDENFYSLKDLRQDGNELMVCKTCGNICYRVDPQAEEKMRNYYRFEYRPKPNHLNVVTSMHKLHYVKRWLAPWIGDRKGLICGDVGCAIGYIPGWLRSIGQRATACEFTVTYRRFAEHYYGVPVTEELETKHRYDLITIYHVLEHMIEPDKKLAHYVSLLKDDGRMLVSTPRWLVWAEESSGGPIISFEHHFHKDHINVFTDVSLKKLLQKVGLVIEKENFTQYGQTYFLRKRRPEEPLLPYPPEPYEEQATKIKAIKAAIDLYRQGKFREAINAWAAFPEAWINLIMGVNGKSPDKQADLWPEALKLLGNNARTRAAYAEWLYQRGEYRDALTHFEWVHENRPNEDILVKIGHCQKLFRFENRLPRGDWIDQRHKRTSPQRHMIGSSIISAEGLSPCPISK